MLSVQHISCHFILFLYRALAFSLSLSLFPFVEYSIFTRLVYCRSNIAGYMNEIYLPQYFQSYGAQKQRVRPMCVRAMCFSP